MHKNVKFLIFSAFLTFALSTLALAGYSLAADTAVDTTAPVISGGFPNSILPLGTTQIEVSVNTNKAAICRYSTTANTDYNSMGAFLGSSAYGVSHTRHITGLVNGTSYTYYVRCQDANGYTNATDYVIRLTVGGTITDQTPPVITQQTPANVLPGTVLGTMQGGSFIVTTNEFADCRYSTSQNVSYENMTSVMRENQANTSTTIYHESDYSLTGLVNGTTYKYYVKCKDRFGNTNTTDFPVIFTLGSSSSTINCVSESTAVSNNLSCCDSAKIQKADLYTTSSWQYYTCCGATECAADGVCREAGFQAEDFVCREGNWVKFTVTDLTAPLITSVRPSGTLEVGTTQTLLQVYTNEGATCRYSQTAGWTYEQMANFPFSSDIGVTGANSLTHETNITGLQNGNSYTYYVRCKDLAGNTNSTDYIISFTVGSSATVPCNYNYTEWSACNTSTNTQTRKPLDSYPSGCVYNTPVTSRTCAPDTSAPYLFESVYSGTYISGSFTFYTNEEATCRYSKTANVSYDQMISEVPVFESLAYNGGVGEGHSVVLDSTTGGSYDYYIRCRDMVGNTNIRDFVISFPKPTCSSFTYSSWSACSSAGTQTRSIINQLPVGCTGGAPAVLTQSCTFAPITSAACTSFTYTPWSACNANGVQARNILTSAPANCTGGSRVLFQKCTPTASAACTSFTYTPWSACNANGVQGRDILNSTPANCTGGSPIKFQKCTPTCSSFSYKAWSACQSNNLQYREVATTSPVVCTGGAPVISQSCTYVLPVITDTSSNPTNNNPAANNCAITPAGGNFFDPTDITITCGANVASASWQWGKYGTPTSFTRNTTVNYPADKTNTLFVKYSYRTVVRGVTYTKTGSAYRTFAAKQSYCKLTPDSGTYAYDTTITITCGNTVTKGTYQWDNGSTTEFTSPTTITYSANRNHKLKVTFTYNYTYNNQTLTKTATFNKFYNLKRCADSEIGAVYQLKGNSVYTVNTTVKNYPDICSGSYLLEYYCGPGHSVKSTRTKCPYGCSNGACVVQGN